MSADTGLRKDALGFPQVYGIMVGIMVAASTLAFLPLGWAIAGPAFLVSIVIAALTSTIAGLNFTELALMYPRATSFVDYFRKAFGDWAGVAFTLNYVVVLTAVSAGAFVIIGAFFNALVPALPWWAWSLLFYGGLLLINVLGVEVLGWSEFAMTSFMIASIAVLGVVGLAGVRPVAVDFGNLTPFAPNGIVDPIWSGVILGVFLFVGFEVLGPLMEEVRNPRRTVPTALVACIGTVLVVMSLFFVMQLAVTPDMGELVGLPGPQIATGALLFAGAGTWWITIMSIIAEGSSVNSAIGGNSRLGLALSRVRALPTFLGMIHPRFRTPWVSIVLVTIAMAVTGLVAGLERFLSLFQLATFMWLVTYFLFCAAVVVLRIREPRHERPFSVGGFARVPLLSLVGMGLMAAIFYGSPDGITLAGGIIVAVCVAYGLLHHAWTRYRSTDAPVEETGTA